MKQVKNENQLGWSMMALVGILELLVAANTANASVNSETHKAAMNAGAAAVTEISFKKDSADLSDGAKRDLQDAIADAGKKGEIKSASVAAWADQEYPRKGIELAATQIELAKKRTESVQSYLQKSLNVADVGTINMAERPSGIQDALKTPEAKTKNALENSGAAPTRSSQTGLFGLKGKASEAIVMIYYKK